MPVYSYKCPLCQKSFDRFLRLVDYDMPQTCDCGAQAVKQLCAPAVRGDYAGYSCPVTGQWIEGRRAHEENLRRHGCRVLEPGETEAARRNHAAAEAEFDRQIEQTAEQLVAGLPPQKLEKLASEMQSGVTATVERQ
jgi:putative FmdB family regulatory protein